MVVFRCALLIATCFFYSSQALAGVCPDNLPRPQVKVTITEAPARFDTSKSASELQAMSSYEGVYDVMVGALMTGKFLASQRTAFRRAGSDDDPYVCVWFEKVEVFLHVDPVIYIAKEYKKEPCEFGVFFEHELKHIAADRELMEDYKVEFDKAFAFAFADEKDFTVGPVGPEMVDAARIKLLGHIDGVLQAIYGRMLAERPERHAEIDTAREYLELTKACPPTAGKNTAVQKKKPLP